jgi:hypothetical protein
VAGYGRHFTVFGDERCGGDRRALVRELPLEKGQGGWRAGGGVEE